jgi:hypothetical protein
MEQLNPDSGCRSARAAGCRLRDEDQTPEALSGLFQHCQSRPTQSSVTVLPDLRQRMGWPVPRKQEPRLSFDVPGENGPPESER